MQSEYAIVCSKEDPAGVNIHKCLLEGYQFSQSKGYHSLGNVSLHIIEGESIRAENLTKQIDAKTFIFATKHKSEAAVDCLSVHVPGNWDKADMGGKAGKLGIAPASLVKALFMKLLDNSPNNSEVTLEATHHGPLLERPAVFIEIGSSEERWTNPALGKVIAKTIMDVIANPVTVCKTCFAIGSTHYPKQFNAVLTNSEFAIGHICPKHNLGFLDKDMIQQAIGRTVERVEFVLLDWKSLGPDKKRISGMLEELNLHVRKTKALS